MQSDVEINCEEFCKNTDIGFTARIVVGIDNFLTQIDQFDVNIGKWTVKHRESATMLYLSKNAQKVRNRRTKVRKSSAKSKENFLI